MTLDASHKWQIITQQQTDAAQKELCEKTADNTQTPFFYFSLSVNGSACFVYDVLIKIPAEVHVSFYWQIALKELLCRSFYCSFIVCRYKQSRKKTLSQIANRSLLTLYDIFLLCVSPGGKAVILPPILHDTSNVTTSDCIFSCLSLLQVHVWFCFLIDSDL